MFLTNALSLMNIINGTVRHLTAQLITFNCVLLLCLYCQKVKTSWLSEEKVLKFILLITHWESLSVKVKEFFPLTTEFVKGARTLLAISAWKNFDMRCCVCPSSSSFRLACKLYLFSGLQCKRQSWASRHVTKLSWCLGRLPPSVCVYLLDIGNVSTYKNRLLK